MDCRPVQWVYVLDSGQRSSVTVKPHHPAALRPGGVGEEEEEDDDEGRIEPSRIPSVTRADVYADPPIAHRFVYILYTRAWIYIVRHVMYARV